MTEPRTAAGYVLGHSEAELRRLAFQAALIEPITRQLLVDAGVANGMRIVDVGTGRGDVAFLAAELVGETGSVVGVDRAPAAIAVARERAARSSLANVSFVEGDRVEPGELDTESLVQQMVDDVSATASFVVAVSEVTAWSRC